jgi:SAM-dependent methyltransferase
MASSENAEIAYWNGPAGQRWVKWQEIWDRVLQPVADVLVAKAAPRRGEIVIDIGCGCGATTFMMAERVMPTGHVLGVDVSAPMLAQAKRRLAAGMPIDFVLADATDYAFAPQAADLLVSRFGVMFFAETVRAFANLRAALRPDGRLAFACFRTPTENLWGTMPLQAAYRHVPPLPKPGPEDPGPFSFADPERVRRILAGAGFVEIVLTPVDLAFDIAADAGLEAAVESVLEIGPTSRAIQDQPPEVIAAVAQSLREVLLPYRQENKVLLPAAIWLATARNPG